MGIANPDVPIQSDIISIKHPANNEAFLLLPANRHHRANPALLAFITSLFSCCISETGFLSPSGDRENEEGVVSMDPDGILTLKQYYYHLINPQADPLYPICLDFSSWRFPHNQLPQGWERTVCPDEDEMVANDSWSVISTAIKVRDKRCRLFGWRDGISTAHIIPTKEAVWSENDPMNLFALRWDLRTLLDQGKWVVVHFISQSYEAAALYHNQAFDTTQLSYEFLFARFVWVIIEKVKSVVLAGLRKRFRLIVSTSESLVNEPQVESAQGTVGTNRKGKKRKAKDAALLDVNDFQVSEDRELEEDLRLAERAAPFFFEEPDVRRDRYHTMMWYPGKSIMERRKREYMDTHPNIHARSTACPSLSSDNSDSGGEN
ncbi:hypothetical protein F5887DRAFT_1280974 [Amanita rubescens]|nr:hypothetical protein F5887DRAFT_1280974 [Amanita rubescens]